MATQPAHPNNESKPSYTIKCSYCQRNNHGVSVCFLSKRDEEYQRYKNQTHRTPQQSFVQNFTI